MDILLAGEHKKAKLRAHSDYMWNSAVNDWALSFLPHADIMVESKAKNLLVLHCINTMKAKENTMIKKWLNTRMKERTLLGWCGS